MHIYIDDKDARNFVLLFCYIHKYLRTHAYTLAFTYVGRVYMRAHTDWFI